MYHVLPAFLSDCSTYLGLLIKQVANEYQALSVKVDVLIWARWVLQIKSSTTSKSCHQKALIPPPPTQTSPHQLVFLCVSLLVNLFG